MRGAIYIAIIVLITGFPNLLSAQMDIMDPPPSEMEGRRGRIEERIENFKIWKLTDYLDLSSEQSQEFFPLYNDYTEAHKDLNDKRRDLFKKINQAVELDDYPEENLKEMLEQVDRVEQDLVKHREKFQDKLTDVLTTRQIAKFTIFEHRFRNEIHEMIQKAREREHRGRPFKQRH
ncbi:MAG: hypothetical protein GF315_04375 [candidate division Zixibacteria bacterium]|nr:hypothetical protein [candidate division Zixibacteria bacterium]